MALRGHHGEAGVAAADRYSTGAAFADTDGDGDLDLILLATTGPNALFLNDGKGQLHRARRRPRARSQGQGRHHSHDADVDGDGDLDLYVANYKPYSPIDSISPQQRAFSQIVQQAAPGRFEVRPEHQRDFRIVMRPDMGGLNLSMRADPDDFYLNDGGRFTREPLTSGRFTDAAGLPARRGGRVVRSRCEVCRPELETALPISMSPMISKTPTGSG